MKKRIFALLLAGLMTASLVSCVASDDGDDTGTGTDTAIVTTAGPENGGWTDADETVYTTDRVKLRETASTTAKELATIDAAASLHCIQKSTSWCKVEYVKDDKTLVGYVSAAYATTEDILGEKMAVCAQPETWYVTEKINIRSYATKADIGGKSTATGIMLKRSDAVKVTAKGPEWFKIEIDGKSYFVSADYLTQQKITDPDDPANYDLSGFSACDKTMFVNTDSLNARVCPGFDASVGVCLLKDAEVNVIATGTLGKTNWCKVHVLINKPGDPEVYGDLYVNAKFLSESKGSSVTMSLDDLMKEYSFVSAGKELYVSAESLNVRSKPDAADKDNVLDGLKKKDKVKVLAVGSYNEMRWAIIEYKTGSYGFVSMEYLSPNPDGSKALVSIDDLPLYYPAFAKCAATSVKATGTVNCYLTPATKKTPDKILSKDADATLVATGKDAYSTWCVVEIDSKYYFAAASLFN